MVFFITLTQLWQRQFSKFFTFILHFGMSNPLAPPFPPSFQNYLQGTLSLFIHTMCANLHHVHPTYQYLRSITILIPIVGWFIPLLISIIDTMYSHVYHTRVHNNCKEHLGMCIVIVCEVPLAKIKTVTLFNCYQPLNH